MGQTERFDRNSTLFAACCLYNLRYETGAEGYNAPAAFAAPTVESMIGAPWAPNGRHEGQVLSAHPSGVWSRWATPRGFRSRSSFRRPAAASDRRDCSPVRYQRGCPFPWVRERQPTGSGGGVPRVGPRSVGVISYSPSSGSSRERLAKGAAGRKQRRASRSSFQCGGGVTAASRSA